MPHPCPHHCPPSDGGSGLGPAVGLAVLVAAAVAAPAVTTAVHVAELVPQVMLITVACVAGVAVLTGMAAVVIRVAQWRAARIADVSFPPLPSPAAQRSIQAPQRKAIEPPRQTIIAPAAVNRAHPRRIR